MSITRQSTFFILVSLLLLSACTEEPQETVSERQMKPEDTEWYEPVPEKVTPADETFLDPPSDAE
ncbi:MAG: hypothetical protein R3222_04785, partial [Balneolaceae bacterium]|nr:hypothetical protein [Balneolaceae bacterium]